MTLNGADDLASRKRSIVLVFDARRTGTSDQTVFMYAVDDARAEGTRVVTASHSVIQPSCDPNDPKNCFDGAIVRNVEVTVYDNDQPDVLVTPLDPTTRPSSRTTNSVVLEGWGTTTARPPDHRAARPLRDLARERADRHASCST